MQKFNLHQHTFRCRHADFGMEDEEYIQEYLKMGFQKIAFTDHCPEKELVDKREDMRMTYEERIGYLDELKAFKEKYKKHIEILSGYEIEYLPGQEKNLKELKEETDILVLGQHFIYDKDGKSLKILHHDVFSDEDLDIYANYIEKAAKLGLPDVIAHPDLFMKARESFGKKDDEITRKICEIAVKYNIPLEINLNNIFGKIFLNKKEKSVYKLSIEQQHEKLSKVSYPNKDFWRIASEYDIRVLYGIDTHHRNQIPLYNDLVHLATKIIGEDTISKLNFIEEI